MPTHFFISSLLKRDICLPTLLSIGMVYGLAHPFWGRFRRSWDIQYYLDTSTISMESQYSYHWWKKNFKSFWYEFSGLGLLKTLKIGSVTSSFMKFRFDSYFQSYFILRKICIVEVKKLEFLMLTRLLCIWHDFIFFLFIVIVEFFSGPENFEAKCCKVLVHQTLRMIPLARTQTWAAGTQCVVSRAAESFFDR